MEQREVDNMPMSNERETIQCNPESVAAWKWKCAFLHEQVENLTDECVVLRASSRSKLETISSLELQVEKLTKERDALVNAIDNEMVVTHMGVFNLGDDPKVALNKICCYAQDLGKFFAEDACKEQLAALAEQVEKLRVERDEYKSGFEAAASKYRNLKLQMQEIINVY